MLYSEIRNKLKSGDLLIWEIKRINSFIDFILVIYQKIFKTKYSHVGIVLKYGNRVFCLEATPPVVRLIPLSLLDDFEYIPLNIKWKSSYDKISLEHIGKKYSIFNLIKDILGIKADKNELYCSMLVSNIYKEIGILEDDYKGTTPKELVEEIKNITSLEPISVYIDRGNLNAI